MRASDVEDLVCRFLVLIVDIMSLEGIVELTMDKEGGKVASGTTEVGDCH